MSPLPQGFINRWQEREDIPHGQGMLYWHVLLGGDLQVREAVESTQMRLAEFPGFHMTPPEWLHMTVLVAGPADAISDGEMARMLDRASSLLATSPPIKASIGRILYHPEAIVLEVGPESSIKVLHDAAQIATYETIGRNGSIEFQDSSWIPHITLGYSTSTQSAAPVISALGKRIPVRETIIDSLHLVVQRGPERSWDWHPVGAAHLLG